MRYFLFLYVVFTLLFTPLKMATDVFIPVSDLVVYQFKQVTGVFETIHKAVDERFEIHSDEKFKAEHGVDRDIEKSLETIKEKIKRMEEPVA